MIKINQAIIVEGKYDKIRLETVVDAPIITTEKERPELSGRSKIRLCAGLKLSLH